MSSSTKKTINGRELDEDFYTKSKRHWDNIDANVGGMLGGFSRITFVDIKSSKRFLSKYFTELDKKNEFFDTKVDVNQTQQQTRALDCGAGIGRVTKHLLSKFFDCVDLLEQNQNFLNESKAYLGPNLYKRVDKLYNCGLQDFIPDPEVKYDCIWCQWVCGYLTDEDFVTFLVRCKAQLKPNGVIVVKDNTTSSDDSDADHMDSSVTRPHRLFVDIFKKANLTLICERKQYKMPKGLYPVSMFSLK